ncbi:MAG: complex I subunit 1 family protein [Phycisphaerales bacterium]
MKLPDFITPQLVVSFVTIALMVHIVLVCVAYLVMAERKVSAYIQDRIGPNRVGFDFGLPWLAPLKGCLGLGQPLADGIKFILKEDYTPERVDKILFTLAPVIIIVPALMGFIVIPWGGVWDGTILGRQIFQGSVHVAGAHINIGFVYLLAVASLGVYGVTLGGWASNNKFSFLGGLRATAQMISYEIPMGLSLMVALLAMGTVLPDAIVRHQAHQGWLLFSQPLAALIFFIAIMAEANRAPFDNAECEQELVGGYHTEYSSMRFALFFLAEYAHLITSSSFFVLVFLGGYQLLPFVNDPLTSPEATSIFAVLAKIGVYLGKVVGVVVFSMVIRWTIPRLRYDQIMMTGWNLVIPLALVQVVVVSFMIFMGWTGILPMLAANVGLMVLTLIVIPVIPRSQANRRLPLYGSRFSPVEGEVVRTAPSNPVALADSPAST